MLRKHARENSDDSDLGGGFGGRLPECRAYMSSDTADTLYDLCDCEGVYDCASRTLIFIAGARLPQLHAEARANH